MREVSNLEMFVVANIIAIFYFILYQYYKYEVKKKIEQQNKKALNDLDKIQNKIESAINKMPSVSVNILSKEQLLNQAYEELTDPKNFIKNFKDQNDFVKWIRNGNIEDLNKYLKAFEKAELYHQCIIIKQIIKEKKLQEKENG